MVLDGQLLPQDLVIEHLRLMERVHKVGDDAYLHLPDGTRRSGETLARMYSGSLAPKLFIRKAPFQPEDLLVLQRLQAKSHEMVVDRGQLPAPLPAGWTIVGPGEGEDEVRVRVEGGGDLYAWRPRDLTVTSAAWIPDGFQPYPNTVPGPAKRRVARNLWMSLWALNDAMKSAGISFEEIARHIPQNEIGIYYSSALGQVCQKGVFGYMRDFLLGERPDSSALAFSLANMPGAFSAAYSTGSLGHISSDIGACATFMVNLSNAFRDILAGRRRFAIVGASDAPIHPWMAGALDVMSAVARDEDLPRDRNGELRHALASRPFGNKRLGFVMGEAAYVVLLADRELALELGLPARGLVCDIACRSDGWKKSISSPGVGDYPALHEVLSTTASCHGIDALRHHSFVSAHGSSTPQNAVTESLLYHHYARKFGIPRWKITAPKSFLGHSMGAAGGLQTIANLLAFEYGVVPKIRNIEEVGVDPEVALEHLEYLERNFEFEPGEMQVAIAVSKGFGGTNVAESIAGPELARAYLFDGTTDTERAAWAEAMQARRAAAEAIQEAYLRGAHMIEYDANRPITVEQVEVADERTLRVDGYAPIRFED